MSMYISHTDDEYTHWKRRPCDSVRKCNTIFIRAHVYAWVPHTKPTVNVGRVALLIFVYSTFSFHFISIKLLVYFGCVYNKVFLIPLIVDSLSLFFSPVCVCVCVSISRLGYVFVLKFIENHVMWKIIFRIVYRIRSRLQR